MIIKLQINLEINLEQKKKKKKKIENLFGFLNKKYIF